jgi:hypothetical protein
MRVAHQRLLMKRWGPQLARAYLRDRLERTGLWSERRGPEVALTSSSDPDSEQRVRELGDALEENGWDVAHVERVGNGWGDLPAGTDVLVVTDPGYGAELSSGMVVAAWILGDVERWARVPWLRRCDLLLAGTPESAESLEVMGRYALDFPKGDDPHALARELTEAVRDRNERWRFCLKLPRRTTLGRAAKLAGALREELERRGHLCKQQLADEWDRLDGLTADVAISLDRSYVPTPAELSVLLVQGAADGDALDGRWDLVAVEDGPLAERLSGLPPRPPLVALGLDGGNGIAPAVDRLLEALEHAADGAGFTASITAPA